MKKPLTIIVAGLFFCFIAKAQIVSIPDAKFKAALIEAGIDINKDGEIQESEALLVDKIAVSIKDIESLQGIAAFKHLTSLRCGFNKLHSIDLSKNIELVALNCSYNELTFLDISQLVKLERMFCEDNKLTALDCSHNNLTLLYCGNNQLTELDLSADKSISSLTLNCTGNPLTKIYLAAGITPNSEWEKDAATEYATRLSTNESTTTSTTVTNKEDKPDSNTIGQKIVDVLNGFFKDDEKKVDNGKCVTGNCIDGIGTYGFTHSDGPATYKGSFKDGKFNGQGTLVIKDQYKYTGSFKNGKMQGKGVVTFSNGNVYTGEMENDEMQGTGTMIDKNGKKSTGIWKESKFWSGTGQFIFGKNDTYYGGVKENLQDGQGIRNYPNGKIFTGTFIKGKPMNGNGYLLYKDSSSYEGKVVNGEFNGKGVFIYSDGEKYEGDFKNSKFDGYGEYHYNDGYVYKGNWADDQRNGKGIFYDKTGKVDYDGEWNNDEKTKPENQEPDKNKLWELSQNIFSRLTFKGFLWVTFLGHTGQIIMTDEYHLNNDYTLNGTKEYIIPSPDKGGPDHRFKQAITGTYDPVTHLIHIITGKLLYEEPIQGFKPNSGASFDGKVYGNNEHQGYYIIKGKDPSGKEFEETDYQ